MLWLIVDPFICAKTSLHSRTKVSAIPAALYASEAGTTLPSTMAPAPGSPATAMMFCAIGARSLSPVEPSP